MSLSYIPNIITVLRIALVPVLILVLAEQRYGLALAIFFVAGVSDALDGFIAKRYDCVTQLGAILDPLADKLLLVSSYVVLTWLGHVPLWLLLAVAFRDLFIIAGCLIYVAMREAVQMKPSYLSKFNTLAQISLVLGILVEQAFSVGLGFVIPVLTVLVFITTVASGIHYFWLWIIRKNIQPVG
ncbi:MAG: CDP-alcohol phosphatidyltransferase family protein [Gammaproteobacteria bacterium]|jgi:cardiolipin synthase|nr:CDP-alcohol phosphatidyltransferase family protein [Gammaproteobacteria bacterium]